MEFGYTEEEEKLRKEVHDFLINELPEDYKPNLLFMGDSGWDGEEVAFWRGLEKKAAERGYPTAGWPKKYGGLGLSLAELGVISEEMGYWRAHWVDVMGYGLVGPRVLTAGTEEQKERFVTPIIRAEVVCFECLTEPDAGSDEANVQLRAVPDGDDFVLNGQKVFITGWGSKPDWLYTLARTADTMPKHRGLSLFMVPGDAPGVTYKPLPTMGGSEQHEIFYEDVRVPKENMLGEINTGFIPPMAIREFGGASAGIDARRGMQWWMELCRGEKRNGKPLIEAPEVREFLAQTAVEMEASWINGWYGIWHRMNEEKLGPQLYDFNMLDMKENSAPSSKKLMDVCGLYGQLKEESKWVKLRGLPLSRWESSRSFHGAGTMEILKVVMGNRGLGLPRIPKQFRTMINEALSKER